MKIGIVCSHGGHLTEMLSLMGALGKFDVFFATYESERTKALSYRKYLFPNFGQRWFRAVLSLPKIFHMLITEKPDIIISNGAEIAIPVFYISRILRIPIIFIECYTRIKEPTITGQLVYPISNVFIVLWPDLLGHYGGKAEYIGEPFIIRENCHYDRKEGGRSAILVTVGMHHVGFDRLIAKVDDVAGATNERVIMQIGPTKYRPKNANFFDFCSYDQMKRLMRESRLVICQGAMTAIDSLMEGTPVVIVPRERIEKEVINDHQTIFANKLQELGLARIASISNLESAISDKSSTSPKMLSLNEHFISELEKRISSQMK